MNPVRSALLLGIVLFLTLNMVRRMRRMEMKERHALVLVGVAIPFLALAIWPQLIERVASWLSIEYGTVMLVGVTAFFLVMLIEMLSVISVLERKVSVLAQMVAILNDDRGCVDRRETKEPLSPGLPRGQPMGDEVADRLDTTSPTSPVSSAEGTPRRL